MSHLQTFTEAKVGVAAALHAGLGGATYGDAILVISSLLSAIAAQLWPGDGIDRKRFVELWQVYSDPSLSPTQISLPFLIASLRKDEDNVAVQALEQQNRAAFCGYPEIDTLVIEGPTVDLSERQVHTLAPHLSCKDIRCYSYPAVFYRDVRSPYVHEFSPGPHSSAYSMSRNEDVVSYVNESPGGRTIHFGMGFLTAVVRSIAASAETDFARAPLPHPASWWVNG